MMTMQRIAGPSARTARSIVARRAIAVARPRCIVALAAAPAPPVPLGKPIEKLKRAPSPFNLFYKAQFAQAKAHLQSKGKDGTLAECSKFVREQWDSLADAQKQPFVKQAEGIKAEFEKAKAAGLIEGVKAKVVDPAGPKPLTIYAAFVKAQFAGAKKANPTLSTAEIAKVIGGQWNALDATKKAAMKAQYDKEMAAYHDRQEKLGVAPPAKPAATKAAAPKAAPPPSAPAAAPKRSSPTPAQQAPVGAKAATSPSRGATPTKRATPAK